MKKKILIIAMLLTAIFGLNINNTFANSGTTDEKVTIVIVSEKVPGADCNESITNDDGEIIGWKCEVGQGASTIVGMLGDIIRYFTYLAGLVGVLFIVYNGILYSMGGADQSLKEESKKRIIGTLIGLILLFLSGPILQLVAPWIYK